ncbi:putative Tyrosinase copper-binding domain-containing protein [Seiridium unicorne]|uniref:Tyrosinase copper-binding domain-containing protein n=1 Tax=Seiridium unicorne TaxID=138068 RepID=A0ABR2UWV6_9PEZI
MPNVDAWVANKTATGKNNNCTLENVAVRREWSDLSEARRQEYLAAVTCLIKLPPEANTTRFPGALNRYDDSVAYHMTRSTLPCSMEMRLVWEVMAC